MGRWQDDLAVRVYVSSAGDFVSLGTRTDYPFQSGGPNGNPLGWVTYDSAGTATTEVNRSVGYGRYNISDNGGTSKNGLFYGAYRDFSVTVDKRYIIQVQARVMDNKEGANRNIRFELPIGSGTGSYSPAYADWENVSIPTGNAPSNYATLRVVLQAVNYAQAGEAPSFVDSWGIQFTNLAIIEQEFTYPPPTWEEVTCDVRSYGVRFGRDRFLNRYDVASLGLSVNNNNGDFSYSPDGWLRPGRFIKIVAQPKASGSHATNQFYGIIDSLTDQYGLDGTVYTAIQAIDISSLLSNTTVPTASWSTSTFLSGNRFKRLIDSVGWHPSMAKIDSGKFVQQAVMANGRTVRDELGLIADSEGSYFFANREGELVYHDRDWSGSNSEVRAELLAQPEPLQLPLVENVKIEFPRIVGNYLQTDPINVTGDLEIVMHSSHLSNAAETLVSRYISGTNYSFRLRIEGVTKTVTFIMGAQFFGFNPLPYQYPSDESFWLKATRRVSDGLIQIFHAPDQSAEPTTNWVLLEYANLQPGVVVPVTTIPTMIGASGPTGTVPMQGEFQRLIIRNGIGGSVLLDVSNLDAYGQPGALSFEASTDQTVTVVQVPPTVLLQDDSHYPVLLPPVDPIPTDPDAVIICTNELQTNWSRDRVVNEVAVANQGGSAFTVTDADSQRKYGPRTYQRMDFLNVNSDPNYLVTRANDLMVGYTESILRVNSVRFRPRLNSYQWALDVFLNEMVRIRYVNTLANWGFSVVSRVQGIEHQLTIDDWVTTLMLDQPLAFREYGGDTDTGNGWDQGLWDVNLWDQLPGTNWSTGDKWSIKPAAWEQ